MADLTVDAPVLRAFSVTLSGESIGRNERLGFAADAPSMMHPPTGRHPVPIGSQDVGKGVTGRGLGFLIAVHAALIPATAHQNRAVDRSGSIALRGMDP